MSRHLYERNDFSPVEHVLEFVVIGMTLSMSVGVIFKRTAWMAFGAFLGLVPLIIMVIWLFYIGAFE